MSDELLRPDSPGFFWRLRQGGRDGAQWHMVTAKMIRWPEEEDDAERVLACTSGGCWQRCDVINRTGYDDGTRYFRATPPAWPNAGGMARELAAQDSESITDLNG